MIREEASEVTERVAVAYGGRTLHKGQERRQDDHQGQYHHGDEDGRPGTSRPRTSGGLAGDDPHRNGGPLLKPGVDQQEAVGEDHLNDGQRGRELQPEELGGELVDRDLQRGELRAPED